MGSFGKILRKLRTERGISQNELSKHIGVSKSSVNMYERGEREPSFETLEAIADYFNVKMDYLLGRDTDESLFSVGDQFLGEWIKVNDIYTNRQGAILKLDVDGTALSPKAVNIILDVLSSIEQEEEFSDNLMAEVKKIIKARSKGIATVPPQVTPSTRDE